jgi:anti-sigma B factor antagonist
MKIEMLGNTMRVSAVKQLGAVNANQFRDWVRKALADDTRNIEIDLSQMTYLDSCGLGALVTLHKAACSRAGKLRLLAPLPPVQQILELTRMDHVFEVVGPPP